MHGHMFSVNVSINVPLYVYIGNLATVQIENIHIRTYSNYMYMYMYNVSCIHACMYNTMRPQPHRA